MRSGITAQLTLSGRERGLHAFTLRQVRRLAGVGLFVLVAFALASLGTWNVADPSFSHATSNPVTNAMGYPGAVFADLAMQFYGLSTVVGLVPAVVWGIFLVSARGVDRMPRRLAAWFAASVLVAGVAGCFAPPPTWPLPTGLGGVLGDMALRLPALFIGAYPSGIASIVVAILFALPGLWLFGYGAGLIHRSRGLGGGREPRPTQR